MNEKDKDLEKDEMRESIISLEDFELNPVSSAEMIESVAARDDDKLISPEAQSPPELLNAGSVEKAESSETGLEEKEADPIFKELAAPKLPELPKENRARLQMQSPNRIYFYWSLKNNPFQTLQKVFKGQTSYILVAKLVNQSDSTEKVVPVEAEGNWWFDVDANATYRAEIGFYAPNRPYFRVMFSNPVETPRKTPSPRAATDADFAVSAREFAEVLNVAGYRQDAFEVAMIGDDRDRAEEATRKAFAHFTGVKPEGFSTINAEELRFALLSIASGMALKDLRTHISPALFALLESLLVEPESENAMTALQQHFDVFTDEIFDEEVGAAVYGASIVNFPKTRKRHLVPKHALPKFGEKLSPVSS